MLILFCVFAAPWGHIDLNKKVITATKLEFDQLHGAEFSLSTSASQSPRILELAVSLPWATRYTCFLCGHLQRNLCEIIFQNDND